MAFSHGNIDNELDAINAKIQAMEAQVGGGPGPSPYYQDYDEDTSDEEDFEYGAESASAPAPTISYRDDVEDRLAWDQQGQVQDDAAIAAQMQAEETPFVPTKTQELTTQTPGGLITRTFSSDKYDKQLANPNLPYKTRQQLLKMRNRRIAKEGMDVTLQTKLLNKFEVQQNDASIAKSLAEAEGTATMSGMSAQIDQLREELGMSPESAEASLNGVNQMWQTEDTLAREEDGERHECFQVDFALATAEQSRVDAAISSKMEPPSGEKGGKGGDLSPHSQAVAMAMPIDGTTASGYGAAFLDSLISQTASAAQIDEAGLRAYIEDARQGSLIRQLAQNSGVSESALSEFINRNGR